MHYSVGRTGKSNPPPIGRGKLRFRELILPFSKKTCWKEFVRMEPKYYIVSRIDGDYAWLSCTSAQEEPYFIARALLPEEIDEGSRLKLENFQFEMV